MNCIRKYPAYSFVFLVFFFLFINLIYNAFMTYFGYGLQRNTFFHLQGEVFSDFFKGIINPHNLSDYFTLRDGEEINLYFRTFKNYPFIFFVSILNYLKLTKS